MNGKVLLSNEEGSVLVLALLMLIFLTIIGIAATTTTSVELQIAQNERVYTENFNRAEAAAMHATQVLRNIQNNSPTSLQTAGGNNPYNSGGGTYLWLHNGDAVAGIMDQMRDPENWVASDPPDPATDNAVLLKHVDAGGAELYPNTMFAAVDTTRLESNEFGRTFLVHEYHCFGLYSEDTDGDGVNEEEVLIEIGLKMRI